MTVFRMATAADIPVMCVLLAELFAQEAEFTPDESKQASALQVIMDNPNVGCLFVAEQGDRVVAMVNILFTVSTALGATVAILEDVVVAEDYRGGKIGSGLLRHVFKTLEEQGIKRVSLLTDSDNLKAQSFYQQLGFELSSMRTLRMFL
jgi:N-acetylglutamate synthase-like GNAT family acetyltransferase